MKRLANLFLIGLILASSVVAVMPQREASAYVKINPLQNSVKHQTWGDLNGYAYRRVLSFNSVNQTTNLTSFPLMVFIDSAHGWNFSHFMSANATDIVFVDADDTTVLSRLRRSPTNWTGSENITEVVNVPQINALGNYSDYIYVYTGKVGVVNSENASAVHLGGAVDAWSLVDTDSQSGGIKDDLGTHTLATTNVTFGATGGTFGGTNSAASKAFSNYRAADTQGTILAWVNHAAASIGAVLSSGDAASSRFTLGYIQSDHKPAVRTSNNTNDDIVGTNGPNVGLNTWSLVGFSSNSTAFSLAKNGVASGLTVIGGSNSGNWYAATPTQRDNIYMGARNYFGTTDQYFNGTIGEVDVFSTQQSIEYQLYRFRAEEYLYGLGEGNFILYTDNRSSPSVTDGTLVSNVWSANLLDVGGLAPTTVYFQYRLTDNSTWINTSNQSKSVTGSFSVNVPNTLFNNQTYHWRSVASNFFGTDYGADQTFTFTHIANPYSDNVVSNMQTGWVASGTGSVALDATTYIMGGQSLKITAPADGTTENITLNLSPALDKTNVLLGAWLRTDNVSAVTFLYASSDNMVANWERYPFQSGSGLHQVLENTDTWYRVTFTQLDQPTGSPDYTAINTLRFSVSNAGGVHVWVGGFFIITQPSQPIISFTFDDSVDGAYIYAVPKLAANLSAGTIYNIISSIGQAGSVNLTQLQEMQNTYGWDVSSHAYQFNPDHIYESDPSYQTANLTLNYSSMQAYLTSNGLNGGQHLAYPGGYFNETYTRFVAKEFMKTARSVEQYNESYPAADWYKLRTIATDNTTPLASYQSYIDHAITHNEWIIFELHDIVAANSTQSQDTYQATFNGIVDYINSRGVMIKPVSWVYQQYLYDANPVASVNTKSAAGISMTKEGLVTGNFSGELLDAGATPNVVYFSYGLTPLYGSSTNSTSNNTANNFTASMSSNLTPGQTYHFRAVSSNPAGTSNGTDSTFTLTLPSVTTGTPTNVGSTATLNGNITNMGVASSTYAYFQWWYDGGAINTTPLQTKNAVGAVTQSITFDPNKVLNTRIVATVGSVSVYGSTTTLPGIQGNSFFKTFIPILFGLVVAFVILSIAFSAGITIQILAIAAIGGTLAYYVVAAIINLLF